MIPDGSYADKLVDVVQSGTLDETPHGPILRAALQDVLWYASPIEGTGNMHEPFGGKEQMEAAVNAYLHPSMARGRLLPNDGTICVEDAGSAVVLRNDPMEKHGLYVADYREGEGFAAVMAGRMKLLGETPTDFLFDLNVPFGAFLENGELDVVKDEVRTVLIAQDLVQATVASLEQLAYMHMHES